MSVVCIRQVTLLQFFIFSVLNLKSQYCAMKLPKVIKLKIQLPAVREEEPAVPFLT